MYYTLIIFDVDGTLVTTQSGKKFRQAPDDWVWLPGRVEMLRYLYHKQRCLLGIATNQGGVGMSYSALKGKDVEMTCEIARMARIAGTFPDPKSIQICYTHPQADYQPDLYRVENDRMRKPNPGMLQNLMRYFSVEAQKTLYVGDRVEDEQAAEHAGVAFQWASAFFR